MFKRIVAKKNLEAAYLKISQDMELDGRLGRYCGWDAWKMADVELRAIDVLNCVREELINFQTLARLLYC